MKYPTSSEIAKAAIEDIERGIAHKAPSALPPLEPQGHCERSRLAKLLRKWAEEQTRREYEAGTYPSRRRVNQELYREAKIFAACADDLRAEMVNATESQPEENTGYEPRARSERTEP